MYQLYATSELRIPPELLFSSILTAFQSGAQCKKGRKRSSRIATSDMLKSNINVANPIYIASLDYRKCKLLAMFFVYWVVPILKCFSQARSCWPPNCIHFETKELNLRSWKNLDSCWAGWQCNGPCECFPGEGLLQWIDSWFGFACRDLHSYIYDLWYDLYCQKGDMNYSKEACSSPALLGRSPQRHCCRSPGVVPVWRGIHAASLLAELSFNSRALDCLGLDLFDLLSSWVLNMDVFGEYVSCLFQGSSTELECKIG